MAISPNSDVAPNRIGPTSPGNAARACANLLTEPLCKSNSLFRADVTRDLCSCLSYPTTYWNHISSSASEYLLSMPAKPVRVVPARPADGVGSKVTQDFVSGK